MVITGAAWVICRVSDARSSCACRSGAFDASMTPARAARSASPCRGSPGAGPAIPTACAPHTTPSPWRWAAIRERVWRPAPACRSAARPCCAASVRPISKPLPPRVLGVDDWAWRKGSATARSCVIWSVTAGHRPAARPHGRDPGHLAEGPSVRRDRRARSRRRLWRRSPPRGAAGHPGRGSVASDLRVFGNYTFPTIRKV